MKNLNLTKEQIAEIFEALSINADEVAKTYQPTASQLIVKFIDGHMAKFNIAR